MQIPDAGALIDRVRSLPAGRPLLERLREQQGVYLVGGAVRDLLLDGTPGDLDLVVEGDPDELAQRLGAVVRSHQRFGTATVSLEGHGYDIARARRERYPQPGALPEVSAASLEEDLPRRDFTVNALAIALGGPSAGELVAPPGALDDLEARRLRVFHERSFIDDPTRLLRLARYASRLRFAIEPSTQELAREAIASNALQTVSWDRTEAELRLAALEPDPVAAFGALKALGVPFVAAFDAELARRALSLLPEEGQRAQLLLSVALPLPEVEQLAARLESARTRSEIAAAVGDASIERVALAGATGPVAQARTWLNELRRIRLEISGRDLLDAGVPEGPAIGEGLSAAYRAKLDGKVAGRKQELAEALKAAS